MIPWNMLTSRDRILLKIAALVVGVAVFATLAPGPEFIVAAVLLMVLIAFLKRRAAGGGGSAPPPSSKRRRNPPGSGPSGGAPVLAPLVPRPVLSAGAARPFPPQGD